MWASLIYRHWYLKEEKNSVASAHLHRFERNMREEESKELSNLITIQQTRKCFIGGSFGKKRVIQCGSMYKIFASIPVVDRQDKYAFFSPYPRILNHP